MDSPQNSANDTCDEDWEDGNFSAYSQQDDHLDSLGADVCIEFDTSTSSAQRRKIKRPTAHEKELAELVHKAHLLCLLARGRIVDSACDDPLIQASLLSMLPLGLLKKDGVTKMTVDDLIPIVTWVRNNFSVKSSNFKEGDFKANLMLALGTREGGAEEIAALSVALFRALNLSARFISVLDAVSMKPGVDDHLYSNENLPKMDTKILSSSSSPSSSKIILTSINDSNTCVGLTASRKSNKSSSESSKACKILKNEATEAGNTNDGGQCVTKHQQMSKRKGDVEFEMQLEMALSATAVKSSDQTSTSASNEISGFKRLKKSEKMESTRSTQMGTGAVWSRKKGPPLWWAEVLCGERNSNGKWIHVDAVNGIIDREHEVESASAAFRRTLKYVLAFAGSGAKDVTRRYCMHWYKIASQRVDMNWWTRVLAPLKQLESAATGVMTSQNQAENSEDMEMEIRGLTEPLPGNQQAYRKHHLYALEKFLTKYEVLYPKGPVLGYCSGHPVYPRSCVKMLHTKQRWLREGLQVKSDETPAKKMVRKDTEGIEVGEDDERPVTELYGIWQVEPLCLPPAVDGIVPKNERGQVEVWSEKCLPPGTVHLRFPRLFAVAKRLGIDYAPAMVGFEVKSGRSFPVFDGIVVCSEFKDALVEAYAEEEEKREKEEKKRRESQALSRWYQLLCSLITRQRLNSAYLDSPKTKNPKKEQPNSKREPEQVPLELSSKEHEHIFPVENQSFDSERFVRTKRCPCGFSIQVEEL